MVSTRLGTKEKKLKFEALRRTKKMLFQIYDVLLINANSTHLPNSAFHFFLLCSRGGNRTIIFANAL